MGGTAFAPTASGRGAQSSPAGELRLIAQGRRVGRRRRRKAALRISPGHWTAGSTRSCGGARSWRSPARCTCSAMRAGVDRRAALGGFR
jgi:hypothetical protein